MENNIVDVEFREIQALEDKDIKTLTAEVNHIYGQMEIVGNVGVMLAIQGGKRLSVIKKKLGHGEWENWMKNNLNFSPRKASYMMKLSKKMDDENSIFSNPKIFADIGISKVYALLGTDENTAAEVLNNPEASDMSAREFKAQIKALEDEKKELEKKIDSANEENEQLKDEAVSSEQERMRNHVAMKELRAKIDELEKELNNTAETDPDDLIALTEKLEEVEKELATEKEKRNALIESQREELEKTVAEEREKISKEMETAELEKQEQYEIQIRQLEKKHAAELEKLKKQDDNQSLLKFKLTSDMAQAEFLKCIAIVNEVAEEHAIKMRGALRKLMEVLIERI